MPRSRRALLSGIAATATAAAAGCSLLQHSSGKRVTEPPSAAWPTRYGGSRATAATDVASVDGEPTQQWPDRTLSQYEAGVFTTDGGGFVIDTETLTAVEPDGSVRWRSEAGYYPRVVLAGDVVVAESVEGGLVGLDRSSGERAWSVSGGDPLAVASGRLFARTGPEQVAALAPGGSTAWTASEHASHSPITAADDGTIVAAYSRRYRPQPNADNDNAAHSRLVAYDAESGDEQWQFDVSGSVQRLAVRDGLVHVGVAIRRNDRAFGALQYALSLDDGYTESRRGYPSVWFDGLAIDGDHAFTATGTTVRAFGPRLGAPDWETSLRARATSLAAAASSVYVTWSAGEDAGTVVAALDTADGGERWRKTLPVGWAEVVGVTAGRVFIRTSETPGLYVLG